MYYALPTYYAILNFQSAVLSLRSLFLIIGTVPEEESLGMIFGTLSMPIFLILIFCRFYEDPLFNKKNI